MERKIRINVLVPDEISYAFDPDADPMFIALREKGKILIKPLTEIVNSPAHSKKDYRKGFLSGMVNGYEDGYHRGYFDADSYNGYDSQYKGSSWLSDDQDYDCPVCSGQCYRCPYYDSVSETCRYEELGDISND